MQPTTMCICIMLLVWLYGCMRACACALCAMLCLYCVLCFACPAHCAKIEHVCVYVFSRNVKSQLLFGMSSKEAEKWREVVATTTGLAVVFNNKIQIV